MPLTILDGIVIVVVVLSAILAMVRGFVREVLSVASWVAAAAAAYIFYEPLVPFVEPYIESDTVAIVIAAAAIFFVALIVASFVTMKVADFVIDSRVGVIDRLLGFVFGAARGLLILVIAFLFLSWLVPQPPSWVAEARTGPMLKTVGDRLVEALPKDIEATILRRFRGEDDNAAGTPPPEDEPNGIGGAPPASGYGSNERRGLDQLIDNSAGGARNP